MKAFHEQYICLMNVNQFFNYDDDDDGSFLADEDCWEG